MGWLSPKSLYRKAKKATKKVVKGVDKTLVEPLEKPVKKVVKAVDKNVVEPLEKPVKKVVKAVDKNVVEPLERPVKKVFKGVKNIADEVFEEVLEKPYKKIVREVVDTVAGIDKTDRKPPAQSQTARARTGAPREEPEEVEATIETRAVKRRRRKKGKSQLVIPKASIAVGGTGSSGLNIPKG